MIFLIILAAILIAWGTALASSVLPQRPVLVTTLVTVSVLSGAAVAALIDHLAG